MGVRHGKAVGSDTQTLLPTLCYPLSTSEPCSQGCVPGATNSIVRVTDAIKKTHEVPPPFPTYAPRDGEEPGEYVHAGPNPWEGLV